MNQSLQVERIRSAVGAYVEDIGVPEYDSAEIRGRLTHAAAPRATLRWKAVAPAAAAAAVVLLIFSSPTVIAQVERMLHAFASINGQPVPVAVNNVTLDQARADMPFAVIAPAAIPAGLSESINELIPSTSRLDSRLLFQFTSGNQPPLTIMESRANARLPQQMRLWMTEEAGTPPAGAPPADTLPAGALPVLPGAHSGRRAFVEFRNSDGRVLRQVKLEPIEWIVRGTRVELISPPGLLSNAQLAAIRRAMLR